MDACFAGSVLAAARGPRAADKSERPRRRRAPDESCPGCPGTSPDCDGAANELDCERNTKLASIGGLQDAGAVARPAIQSIGPSGPKLNGSVEQSNFNDYEPTRIADMPNVEVHIVKSSAAPSGIGEPGVPPVAPSIGNAIFAATGKRLRSLPFDRTMPNAALRGNTPLSLLDTNSDAEAVLDTLGRIERGVFA